MVLSLVLIAAVLPALALLYFIYRKDNFRTEPPDQILKAFFLGMLAAPASMLISGPLLWLGVYTLDGLTAGENFRLAFFGAALPEETAKFIILWLFLRKNKFFDEWVDGIVYATCIGLGFAALENIQYLFQHFNQWAYVGATRAVLSVPAHFFFAVAMGFFYSKARFGNPARSRLNYALALAVPILLHGLFDFPLMLSDVYGITAALVCLFAGVYIFMVVRSRKFFLAHHAIDATAAKVDDAIRAELEDAADGRRDNPVGDVIYLPDKTDHADS